MAGRVTSAPPTCSYCGSPARLTVRAEGAHVTRLWLCAPCNAHVGCHRGTETPLGTLANAELRAARTKARDVFNLIWRLGGKSRTGAHLWLASKLGIETAACRIDLLDLAQCARTIEVSTEWRRRKHMEGDPLGAAEGSG